MKNRVLHLLAALLFTGITTQVAAETLRCKNDIVEIGDIKADVVEMCGKPEITDTYCEKYFKPIYNSDGSSSTIESCVNVDIWTYNPGKGQFWTNLYFSEGKLREIKYGNRVK